MYVSSRNEVLEKRVTYFFLKRLNLCGRAVNYIIWLSVPCKTVEKHGL